MTLPTRRCMVCRKDLLKGFYRHRTDPICMSCVSDVAEQRALLTKKFRAQYNEERRAAGKKPTVLSESSVTDPSYRPRRVI